MKDREEAKTKNLNYLKGRAESVLNLVDVLTKIWGGEIICRSSEVKRNIEILIADLCEEIYSVVTYENKYENKKVWNVT